MSSPRSLSIEPLMKWKGQNDRKTWRLWGWSYQQKAWPSKNHRKSQNSVMVAANHTTVKAKSGSWKLNIWFTGCKSSWRSIVEIPSNWIWKLPGDNLQVIASALHGWVWGFPTNTSWVCNDVMDIKLLYIIRNIMLQTTQRLNVD